MGKIEEGTMRFPFYARLRKYTGSGFLYWQSGGGNVEGSWGASVANITMSTDTDGSVWTLVGNIGLCPYLEILLVKNSGEEIDNGTQFVFDEISIEKQTEIFSEYVVNKSRRIIRGAEGSNEEADVSLLFTNERDLFSQIIGGNSTPQSYDYLKTSRNQLVVRMKKTDSPENIYVPKWLYWMSGWKWRVIAMSFDPWNDDYTITLQRSTVL